MYNQDKEFKNDLEKDDNNITKSNEKENTESDNQINHWESKDNFANIKWIMAETNSESDDIDENSESIKLLKI